MAGIYKNRTSTGNKIRHIIFGDRWELGIENRDYCFWPIQIGDKVITTKEIESWINEVETVVDAKIQSDLKVNPKSTVGWLSLAYLYWGKQMYPKSVDYFVKAIEVDPNSSEAWYQFGMLNERMEKYEDAMAKLDKSISIDNKLTNAYYEAGLICVLKLNDVKRAEKYWRKFIELQQPADERSAYVKEVLSKI